MDYELLIKNGTVFTGNTLLKRNIYVKGRKIIKLSESIDAADNAGKVIDAEGKYVFPGFIDPHVHLNDPGLTESEDFFTGTCAAAAGGVTTVLEHPLTFPLPSKLKPFDDKKSICQEKTVVNFSLFGACTPDNKDEMIKIIEDGAVAFKAFMTYSPEIPRLNDGQIIDRMKYLANKNIVLAVHCENNDIVEENTQRMKNEGKISYGDYPSGRPEISEIEAVSRICLFAEMTGCKVNVAHCTLKSAVDKVWESKKKGVDISVETCPQYLVLDQSMMNKIGVFSICNPPLRNREEVERLWSCLLEGKIDWVCSDHAPYTIEEKMAGKCNVFDTPAGVTGIETTYQVLFSEGVIKRGMSIADFVALSSTNAAKRYRMYPNKGEIAEGKDADIVIFDPCKKWTVKADDLKQKIKWTPFDGLEVQGKVLRTIVNGIEVFNGKDIIAPKGIGRYVRPFEV